MKTIKIMIAASEEMHEEKLEFTNLIEHLNEVLEPRGIKLKRIKWSPESDGSIEEFKSKLGDCEMCLTLYWRELAGNSERELDTAYQELKNGNNPRNLYVFFKEPTEDLSEALKDFKANFVTKYGHFFCKFENADTMNLHFILQFETYQNLSQSDIIKVSDGRVSVGGRAMVDLSKVSFAALNKEYQRLQYELKDLDKTITSLSIKLKKNKGSKALIKQLKTAKLQYKELKEEFDTYQKHLYSIALSFAKKSAEQYSERMIRARELFEQGNVIEADRILDLKELKQEASNELTTYEQQRKNLELKIEEFQLKAETVMANSSLGFQECFRQACEAMEEAIYIARKINYNEEKYATLLFSYATLLQQFNQMLEAVGYYQEALTIRRRLATSNPDVYRPILADTLNNIGALFSDLHQFNEAESNFREALEIRSQLASANPDLYLSSEAVSLCNLGGLLINENRNADAEPYIQKGMSIYRRLTVNGLDAYQLDLADALCSLGTLQAKLCRFEEAEKSYNEALVIFYKQASSASIESLCSLANLLNNVGNMKFELKRYAEAEKALLETEKLRRMLTDYIPSVYLPDLAKTLYNLGAARYHLKKYDDAENNCKEALEILRPLADANPEAYLPHLAVALTNYGALQDNLEKPEEAEKTILESLEIHRRLAADRPDAYQKDVADSLNNLAIIQKNLKQYSEAEQSYLEALNIYRQLAKDTPDIYRPDLAETLGNYGNLLRRLERYVEAKKCYSEALVIYLQLREKHPGAYQTEAGKMAVNMSDVQEKIGPGLLTRLFRKLMKWCNG